MEALRECAVRPGSAAYADVVALYEEAFPPEERVGSDILDAHAGDSEVEYTAYYDGELFCGFSYSIVSDGYLYLLFLAVPGASRSHGCGTRILDQIKARFPGRVIVLEVEPPDPLAPNADQRQSRLDFYRRNGFSFAGFDSIEGEMVYALLKTQGPFDAEACTREISRALRGLVPFELIASAGN